MKNESDTNGAGNGVNALIPEASINAGPFTFERLPNGTVQVRTQGFQIQDNMWAAMVAAVSKNPNDYQKILNFHNVARPTRVMNVTFGEALEELKKGFRIARAGWNGKNMFLYLNKGSFDRHILGFAENNTNPMPGAMIDGIWLHLFEMGDKGTATRLPNINMRSASGSTVTGWLASQTDMLASDWCVVYDDMLPKPEPRPGDEIQAPNSPEPKLPENLLEKAGADVPVSEVAAVNEKEI